MPPGPPGTPVPPGGPGDPAPAGEPGKPAHESNRQQSKRSISEMLTQRCESLIQDSSKQ